MLKVALTGGIATGKSYVRARIAGRGVPTADADAIVHALLGPGTESADLIVRRFGRAVCGPDGAIDRKALGAIVFADPTARRDLESVLHPRVYARIDAWLSSLQQEGTPWALADIPLLFETGRQGEFDRVLVVVCDPEEQLRRLVQRDGLAAAAARGRLAAQWPIAEKVRLATDVIETGGTFEQTDRQVDEVCTRFDALARSAPDS